MLSQSDARGITSTYDVLNRLTSIVYPTTSENVTLTYDNCTGSTNTMLKKKESFPPNRITDKPSANYNPYISSGASLGLTTVTTTIGF